MNEQEQPRRRRRRLYRTSADWFGLAAMGLLMICSLVLLVQLMSTKLLTDLYLILIEIVLLLINAGHVIIQLPIRRVKTSKVVCGLLAVILSGLMLYGSVAAASGKSALLAIAGKNLQKTTSYVVVMADDPARSIGDTVGYTFGILSEDADISADNTSALLDDIKDGLGGRVDTSTYADLTSLADALYDGNAGAIILNPAISPPWIHWTITAPSPRTPGSSMSSAPPRSWSPSSPTLPSPPSPSSSIAAASTPAARTSISRASAT
jgi:hypothetical protein